MKEIGLGEQVWLIPQIAEKRLILYIPDYCTRMSVSGWAALFNIEVEG